MVVPGFANEWSAEDILRVTAVFASLSVLVSSLEYLTLLPHFRDQGLLSARTSRTQRIPKWARVLFQSFLSPRGIAVILGINTLAASWCLLLPSGNLILPLTLMVAAQCVVHYRFQYGLEGSDQMTMILLVMSWAAAVCPTEPVRVVALGFIAVQSCLSYFIAGVSKLCGPAWRGGTAVRDVLRTRHSGHPQLWRLFHRSPCLTRGVTYLVILFECIFPLVLLLPTPWAVAFLSLGCLFHLGNGIAMGFNAFIWAFIGTYPAILYCSRFLSQSIWF